MGRWLEHTVTSEVQASADRVWDVWSDLEAMPKWMRWIESVKTLDDPELTDWTLAAQGFRFHWKARITQRVEAQQLHWESVGGLPTRGAVRFITNHQIKFGYASVLGCHGHWKRLIRGEDDGHVLLRL